MRITNHTCSKCV